MRIAVNTRLLLKDKLEGIGWVAYETLRRMVKDHPDRPHVCLWRQCETHSVVPAGKASLPVHLVLRVLGEEGIEEAPS